MQPTILRRAAAAAGGAAALALAWAPSALAQQPAATPTETQATAALDAAEQALDGAAGDAAAEVSVAMNELAASLPALQGTERRHARGLLARPTDRNDQYGDSYPPAAPIASAESAHFCAFWVNAPGFDDAPDLLDIDGRTDGDGIPDYVESILEIAEYSYSVEVSPGTLGWQPPKRDVEGCGADPGARADIYLKQLGKQGLFGYESPDPGQGTRRSQYGYLVLDDDYSKEEYGSFADPLAPAKVTFAHEFNHLLQQNYDSYQDLWMFEATATWSEEQVYPEINDYVNYVRSFANSPGTPITDRRAAGGLKIYGSAVWSHWLATGGGGYGLAAIRRAWEVSGRTHPPDLATAAYDKAIRDHGGRGFAREFVRFAAATGEWRTGFGGFPDAASYPDVKRKGSLRRGRMLSFPLDHTAYRLLDVTPRGTVRLRIEVEPGTRAGIALVAREGDALTGGVVTRTRYLDDGGRGSVSLSQAGSYERVTAVVVNADARTHGFRQGEHVYTRDARQFELGLS